MAENYFDNIRTVGATLDNGIHKLQETWEMPPLLLCKSKEEDHIAAKKLIEKLRDELRHLKESLNEHKTAVASIRETQTQFLEETTGAIKALKEEVDDIRVLFAENGYVEEPIGDDLSVLNRQLESLSVSTNNNSLLQHSEDMSHSYNDNASFENHSYTINDDVNIQSPKNNVCLSSMPKKLLNKKPVEPNYSPYYYKMMKKR